MHPPFFFLHMSAGTLLGKNTSRIPKALTFVCCPEPNLRDQILRMSNAIDRFTYGSEEEEEKI
jgi:hypothetical protein